MRRMFLSQKCIAKELFIFAIITLVLHSSTVEIRADKLPPGFFDKTISDDMGTHKYVEYVPKHFDRTKKWPVVLSLHGSGERGSDNRKQLGEGIAPAIRKNPKLCSAIVLFPQAESKDLIPVNVWAPTAPDGARALRILDRAQEEYSIDPDRVYLTGYSMGGIGTWKNAIAAPNRWAAIVPICGGGDTYAAKSIAKLPIWCFHGTEDGTVAIGFSRIMIRAIEEAGGHPKYTEYPGVDHDSWTRTYANPALWSWLLAQKRQKN